MIQHVLLEDQNIPYCRVQNRAGNFMLPGQANFSTLGPEFTLPQSVTSPDWVSVVLGNSSESTPAYLACLTNGILLMLLHMEVSGRACQQAPQQDTQHQHHAKWL